MNLFEYKELIDNNPSHIATVSEDNKPNIAVVSNIRVIDKDKLVISVNEMVNTQNNIQSNENVVLTIFDKNWIGLRLFGTAKFYESGEYYDFCYKTFYNGKISKSGRSNPKGAIVVTINKIEEYN